MSAAQQQKRKQIKQARLEIVAEMYKKGNSISKIASEVQRRLGLDKEVSKATIHRDIQTLLVEWRESRIEDVDLALQLELERIDHNVRELYDQWDKSKTDYVKTSNKRKGAPRKNENGQGETLRTY
ncbi:MAG: hypothetical protein ACRCZB_01415, partial [Bacteroidales bacterium]